MKKVILSAILASMMISSCTKEDEELEPMVPEVVVTTPSITDIVTADFTRDKTAAAITSYSTLFTRDGESTVNFGGQTTRLKQAVEVGSNLKSKDATTTSIREKFEGKDDKSSGFTDTDLNGTTRILRSKTSSSTGLFGDDKNSSGQGKTNVEAVDAFITGHDAVVAAWTTTATAGVAGTFLDNDGSTRYVNGKGHELDQLFTKSMAGALVYDQSVNHYFNRLDDNNNGDNAYRSANDAGTVKEGSSYTTMEHHWDESFGYIYGNIAKENLIYKYIDNVDALPKFGGFEKEIFEAYVEGRIAIVAKDYVKRDAQVEILRERLSLVIAARSVNYLVGGAKLIGDLADGDAERVHAFHDLAEGYGFINSLRYIVKGDNTRYFTDTEVDGFLTTLNASNGFWSVTKTQLLDMADEIATKNVGGKGDWVVSDIKS